VYSQERTLVLDNFRSLQGYGFKGFSSMKGSLDKGHKAQFGLLVERLRQGGAPLISLAEIFNTSQTALSALTSLQEGRWVTIDA
jgi:hypothetical protein